MMKSLASVAVALLAYTVVASTVTRALGAPISSELSADGQAEPYDWRLSFETDRVQTSVGCVLFGDLGCDAECFTVTSAYGLLGTGICIEGKVCSCNFAADTTLEGIWHQKFGSNSDSLHSLQTIKTNPTLFEQVHRISSNPFQTGQQIKKKLKQALPSQNFDELEVTDNSPAWRIFLIDDAIDQEAISIHIDAELPKVIELSNQKLSDFDYKSALEKILKDYDKRDKDRLKQLLHQLRRIGNESMKSILRKYPEDKYPPPDYAKMTHDIDPIIDKAIDALIKKVDQAVSQQPWWTKWIKNPFSGWSFASCIRFTSDPDETEEQVDFVTSTDVYQLPSKVYDEIPYKPCPATGKGDGYKIRYCANKNGVDLNWIKKSLKVSILKTSISTINQNWDFGIVTINITRTSEGRITQNWNYAEGTSTHRYQYSAGKDEAPHGKWSDGQVRDGLLNSYKSYMHKWCVQNKKFIDMAICTIFYKNKI